MINYLARLIVVSLVALGGILPQAHAAPRAQIVADVDAALYQFEHEIGGVHELMAQAAGVLVFPSVVKAGAGIGGEYGTGALLRAGIPIGYYNIVSASIGFQFGVQVRTVIIAFMTEEALGSFRRKHGWKVGVDGSVTLIAVGVGGSIDTNQINKSVVGFILDQKGLMYNLTLEGSKISRIDP